MIRFSPRAAAVAAAALAASLAAQGQTSSSTATTPRSAASAVGATAQGATAGADAKRAELARGDRKFIETAALGGMAEVELGKMAQGKASNAQVKEFAQRMVTDHGKANEELMSLASAKGVQPPAALDRSHRNEAEKLGKRSGANFDREYIAHQLSEHRKTVSEFKKAADSAKDPQLKAWAAKTLPTLEEHHKMAQSLHDSLKGKDRSAAANKS